MQQRQTALLFIALLLVAVQVSDAQRFRLPNIFRRPRQAGALKPGQKAPAAPTAAALPVAASQALPAAANSTAGSKCGGTWAIAAIGASAANVSSSALPLSTSKVLVCLISSGVHKDALPLKHNRWTGCTKEDSLDPTGCALPWAVNPGSAGYKPRGTWVASIMAARSSGLIPGSADIHVVPVDSPGAGAVDPGSAAPSGKSRLRAYSVCEGRLRGLQAMDYGSSSSLQPWRMVMLVDVAADKPATNGPGDYVLTEAEWVAVATGSGTPEAPHAPDVLVIAPTGHNATVSYPAAIPGVLGVGGYKCNGEPLQHWAAASGKPDILAPGVNIPIPGTDKAWTDSAAAAALVAGSAARLWSAYPRCNADEIRAALLSSVAVKGQAARLLLPAAVAALEASPCGSQPLAQ